MSRSIQACLRWAAAELTESDSPGLDAEVLLAHLLGAPRSYLRAWPERELADSTLTRFRALVAERAAGRPIAHLVGRREFWSLPLRVTADTLIPRPETEHLVEAALDCLKGRSTPTVLDLGTGSGAIALAIATERPDARIAAVERSARALAVAQGNARALDIDNVRFLLGEWYAPVQAERFDMIVSNPPYIAETEPELRQGDARFDPGEALLADADGLADIGHIVAGAEAHLCADGWLAVEHGYRQGAAVRSLLHSQGFASIDTQRDLQGHERITLGRAPS